MEDGMMDIQQTHHKDGIVNVPAGSESVVNLHACQTLGEGSETSLLLHCSASTGGQWNSLGQHLAQQQRVLLPDLFGHGNSQPWHGQTAYMLEQEIGALLHLLEQTSAPVHLVGHSYGGALALMLALRLPQRLRSLTLIEPVAPFILRPDNAAERYPLEQLHQLARTVQTALLKGDDWAGMGHFIDYWNGTGSWDQLSVQRQAAYAQHIRAISQHFQAAFSAQIEPCELRELRVPTLLLRGDRSPMPTHYIADKLAATLPGVSYQIIARAGHMVPLTHATAVNSLICAHIQRNSDSDSVWGTRSTMDTGLSPTAWHWIRQDSLPVWANRAVAA
ncbi:MAG: alpha/beta hydrolase [Gammaproteobacteria bacterium]